VQAAAARRFGERRRRRWRRLAGAVTGGVYEAAAQCRRRRLVLSYSWGAEEGDGVERCIFFSCRFVLKFTTNGPDGLNIH
jgi:hypothetical protein